MTEDTAAEMKVRVGKIFEGLDQYADDVARIRQEAESRTDEILSVRRTDAVSDHEFVKGDYHIVKGTEKRQVLQWQVGSDIIYTRTSLDIDQVLGIAKKVSAQRAVLGGLTPEEQAGIQEGFETATQEQRLSHPFGDYLQSEALGRHFAELKQNPPRPFSN